MSSHFMIKLVLSTLILLFASATAFAQDTGSSQPGTVPPIGPLPSEAAPSAAPAVPAEAAAAEPAAPAPAPAEAAPAAPGEPPPGEEPLDLKFELQSLRDEMPAFFAGW